MVFLLKKLDAEEPSDVLAAHLDCAYPNGFKLGLNWAGRWLLRHRFADLSVGGGVAVLRSASACNTLNHWHSISFERANCTTVAEA